MLTAAQIETRRERIGSSEIAVIADQNPYRTEWDVWAEKMGVPVKRDEGQTKRGHRAELLIAENTAERLSFTGLRKGETVIHPRHNFAAATPDYFGHPRRRRDAD